MFWKGESLRSFKEKMPRLSHLRCSLGMTWILLISLASCQTLKPYEKEYLLHPTMDDAVTGKLTPNYAIKVGGSNENLSQGGGGGQGSACPTCGG